MKRTSLWEMIERVPIVVRTAKESVLKVLDVNTEVREGDMVALYKPTRTNGRNVVERRGRPCKR